MRLIKLTDADAVRLKDSWQTFPIWIDADRVACISPAFQEQTYGGHHFTLDGARIQFGDGQFSHVKEDAETVAGLLGWQPTPS